jgi:hypothetical protein
MNIANIPTAELLKDLDDSYADLLACEAALTLGIVMHNGMSIQYRLDANKHFIEVIMAELKLRKDAEVSE